MNRDHMPYPELVEPVANAKPYRVEPSDGFSGSIDLVRRIVVVPDHPRARSVCRHENGHARFSPPKLPPLDFPVSCMQAVEDARVNLANANLEVPVDIEPDARERVLALSEHDLKMDEFALFVLRCVASIGVLGLLPKMLAREPGAHPRALELARDVTVTVERELRAQALSSGTPEAPFEVGLELARKLASVLAEAGFPAPARLDTCACIGVHMGTGELNGGEGVRSGTMRVVHAPAALPMAPGRNARGRGRPVEEGSVISSMHRWIIDGRIFRRRVRRSAGTVLIDVSGSMRLSPDDIDRIVAGSNSALTVAIYSGRRDEGELRVIVHGGRRASSEQLEPFAQGNVIDLPALKWLARQEGPRIWVSDGGVTGVNDQASPRLRERCLWLCREARIRRVPDAKSAAKALRA